MVLCCEKFDTLHGQAVNALHQRFSRNVIGYFRMQCGNITQEALASKINRSREFLAKIEKGTEHPSVATLVDIADALCISIDDLLIFIFLCRL